MTSSYTASLPSESGQPSQQTLVSSASESTPLLRSSDIADIVYDDIPLTDAPDDMTYDLKEAAFIFRQSVPIVLTYLIEFSLQIVSVISLGHLVRNLLHCDFVIWVTEIHNNGDSIDFIRDQLNWPHRHWHQW